MLEYINKHNEFDYEASEIPSTDLFRFNPLEYEDNPIFTSLCDNTIRTAIVNECIKNKKFLYNMIALIYIYYNQLGTIIDYKTRMYLINVKGNKAIKSLVNEWMVGDGKTPNPKTKSFQTISYVLPILLKIFYNKNKTDFDSIFTSIGAVFLYAPSSQSILYRLPF